MLLISKGQGGLHSGQTATNNQDPAIQRHSLGAHTLGKAQALDGRSDQARSLSSGGVFIAMNPGTMLADIDSTDEVRIYVVRGESPVEGHPVVGGCAGGNECAADSLVLEGGEELVGAAGLAEGVATENPGDAGQSAGSGGDSGHVKSVIEGTGTFTQTYGQASSAAERFGLCLRLNDHL